MPHFAFYLKSETCIRIQLNLHFIFKTWTFAVLRGDLNKRQVHYLYHVTVPSTEMCPLFRSLNVGFLVYGCLLIGSLNCY